MFNILVAEDNIDLLDIICVKLRKNGYNPIPARNGLEALDILDTNFVDLLITDIMMPDMDGFELIKSLRDADYSLPILVITAKTAMSDMKTSFTTGADDYITKPVNYEELILRIEALLRRAKITNNKKITIGQTVVDYDALTVTYNKNEMLLPQKEFYLLYKLLSYPNKIFTRQQLMDEFWGFNSDSDEHTVTVHINRLRDKMKKNPDFEIITIRGLGYKAVIKNEN